MFSLGLPAMGSITLFVKTKRSTRVKMTNVFVSCAKSRVIDIILKTVLIA